MRITIYIALFISVTVAASLPSIDPWTREYIENHHFSLYEDVVIVGSGPIGSTYARKLVEGGRKVLMVEAGVQERQRPGEHLKNAFKFQRDVNSFTNVIKAALETISVPTKNNVPLTLDPIGWHKNCCFVRNGQNPDQDRFVNLPASAFTYAVGGMATHWTCAVPRQHELERSDLLTNTEYETLYEEAEKLVHKSTTAFKSSIRNTIVQELIRDNVPGYGKTITDLPLAVERRTDNPKYVTWTGVDTILGPLINNSSPHSQKFTLLTSHRCNKLVLTEDRTRVEYIEVEDLMKSITFRIYAKTFILCGGAVLTPQILFNSGDKKLNPYPLGRYLSEQTIAFAQIVLNEKVVTDIGNDARWADKVQRHRNKKDQDPLPIPFDDPDPQCWIPFSDNRTWHVQIHRDAFSYGEVAETIDNRLVVDLRWFARMQPRAENRVYFSYTYKDKFGMPQVPSLNCLYLQQATFNVTMSERDKIESHQMIKELTEVAHVLGGYLPGSEPQFMEPGLALHITGTYRAGRTPKDSVVDVNSKFWGIENLFLGGNGVIPTGTASNPTLTSIVFALKSCQYILSTEDNTPITYFKVAKLSEIESKSQLERIDRGIKVTFATAQDGVDISPTWSLAGWEITFAELAPDAKLDLDKSDTFYVKVIAGSLVNPERGNVPPPNNKAFNLRTEGTIEAGPDGAVLGIYAKTKQAPEKITNMSQLVFTGPMSEVLTWQVMEKYKGEQFNSKAFFNAHGIELWNSKNEYISYQQWWTSGKGVDCLLHNHAQDNFLEVHMYMWNGSGGGHVHMYRGEEYVRIILNEGDEHPPFWLYDNDGAPLKDGKRIRYWYHGSESGGALKPTYTDDSDWSESFDVWVVHEIHPDKAIVPV